MEIINKNLIKTEKNSDIFNLTFTFFDMKRKIFETKIIYLEIIGNNEIFNIDVRIKNYETFLKYIFPECKVENYEHTGCGVPDFKLIDKDGQEFYIEYKSRGDSLRLNQLAWMFDKKNIDKEIYILSEEHFINHEKDTNVNSAIKPTRKITDWAAMKKIMNTI